jgi:two-component system response regulator ChvI
MTARLEQGVVSLVAAEPALLASVSKTDAIRVLLIEDDPFSRETLTDELSKQGLAIQSFGDDASLFGALNATVDAAVVVIGPNWRLPKIPGIDLLAKLRRQGVNIAVVLLIYDAQPAHECLAFDRGAIRKSHDVNVLVSRLKNMVRALKRAEPSQSDKAMMCGKLLLHPDVNRAYWNDVDLDLTVGEYNIVHVLASNGGRHIAYRAIYDRLHYEGFIAGTGPNGYRANVRSAIRRIRNKFRAQDPTFDNIENLAGFGYCWKQKSA